MILPAPCERVALAIISPGPALRLAKPWTRFTNLKASDFAVNTESPDARQLPIHFLGFVCAKDSKSFTAGGSEETSLNTSTDASLASGGGQCCGKKDGQFTGIILRSALSFPAGASRGGHFGVEIKELLQPFGVVLEAATNINTLQHFIVPLVR